MSSAFRRAAEKHLSRSARGDRALATRLAAAIAFDTPRPVVVAVPMHVTEQVLPRYLRSIDSGLVNVCLVVNAFSDVSEAAFDEAYEVHRAVVAEWNRSMGGRIVSVHGVHLAGSTNMGRVRSLVCDALIARALATTADAPVIVCNDVDQIVASPAYFDDLLRCIRSEARPAAAAGPVGYGYVGRRPLALPDDVVVPELYLFNEIHDAINRCARSELGARSRVWPEGANFAFSMEAYCEAGGFDVTCGTAEDDALGEALYEIATPASAWSAPVFVDSAWVATDPRRVLHALLGGRAGIEAWAFRRFDATPGAGLDFDVLARRCATAPRLLTLERLADFDPQRRDDAWELVTSRVGWHFFRSVAFDCRPQSQADVACIANAIGIALVGGNFDRAARSFEATVDWGRSSILERLTALVRDS